MSTGEWQETDGEGYESMASAIVAEIAEQEGVNARELDTPLYEIIDPDALNVLFSPTESGRARSSGRVEFTYCGYQVTAYGDGHVRTRKLTDSTDSDSSKGNTTAD